DAALVNAPSLEQPAIVSDNGTAIAFSSASSQSVELGGLGALGSSAATNGITFVCWITSTHTAGGVLMSLASPANDLAIVRVNFAGSGDISAELSDSSGNTIDARSDISTGWNDGSAH